MPDENPLMQPALASLGHVLLALHHDLELGADLVQPAQHLLVPVHELEDGVLDARVVAELPHQRLDLAQVMPRHAREEVVAGLELEAAVDEVEPGGAVDVHGGAELALGEGLGVAEHGGGHAPVGQGDLDVQRHGDEVGDEDEGDADGPGGQGEPDQAVAEDVPEGGHHGELGGADPPGLALAEGAGPRREEVDPREEVEVEARDAHDGVVGEALVGDQGVGDLVPVEGEVVVGRAERLEEGGAGGEEGDVLDVGVVLLEGC